MNFSKESLITLLTTPTDEILTKAKEIGAFYSYIFKEIDICISCPNKIKYYFSKLKKEGVQNLKEMEKVKRKFELREDIVSLQVEFGNSFLFNNTTLTDEIALQYLSKNKNRIENFSQYPKNWEKLVEDYLKKEQKELEQIAKEQEEMLKKAQAEKLEMEIQEAISFLNSRGFDVVPILEKEQETTQ